MDDKENLHGNGGLAKSLFIKRKEVIPLEVILKQAMPYGHMW
jgi:hypothetical protein